jgi:hypothetical protein
MSITPRALLRGLSILALMLSAVAMVAAVEPEVSMQRGATTVLDGATDSTGTASNAQAAYDLTYTVRNIAATGADSLTVGAVVLGTATNATCSVLLQPATVVTAGSSTVFTIRVIPTVQGAWSVPLSYTTNDTSESVYDFTVTGTAQAPVAEINVLNGATSIADGSSSQTIAGTVKGIVSSVTYTISNTAGGATLNVTIPVVIGASSNCSALVTAQPSAFVAAGSTTTFTVEVTPGQGAWSYEVQIINSDANEGFYTFTVSGTAEGPEIAVNRGSVTILDGSTDVPLVTSVAGEQTSLTYTIANTGAGVLNLVRYPADAQVGELQFSAVRHWTEEGGSVDVTVKRVGGNRGIVSVDWYVDSDSAVSDLDFSIQSGTLSWADGDVADKTFTVSTLEDINPEGTERFFVRLHNAQGGATISAPLDATIAIEDEDAVNGTSPGGTTTWESASRAAYTSESPGVRMIEVTRSAAGDSAPFARIRVELEDGTATLNSDYAVYTGGAFGNVPLLSVDATVTWGTPGGYAMVWYGDTDNNDLWDAAVYSNGTDYLVYIGGDGTAQVPVSVLGDTTIEPIESLHLKLSDQSATALGTATSSDHDYLYYTLFITDDDASAQTTIITEEMNCSAVVMAVPDRIVDPASTTGLPIRVVPATAGYWQFRVTIENDDANEPAFTWLVTGNAHPDVPDIVIRRNGATVVDGGTDTVNALVAGVATTLTYTIGNTGTADLTVTTPATVTAVSNCAVGGGNIAATNIGVGGTTTMTVSVTPSAAGSWSATLAVANNDPDENPYNITLTGVATAAPAPEFQWYRAGATLTPIATGATDDRTDMSFIAGVAYTVEYRVANIGSANLTITADSTSANSNTSLPADPNVNTVSPIAANGLTSVSFTFTPTAAGAFSFTYGITGTNDTDEPNPSIIISGTASAAAPDAAIYRNNVLIPNGYDDAPTGLVATQSTVLTYGLSNLGSSNLTLTLPVTISGETNCTATVVTQPATPIAAGAATQVQISVTPTVAGPYSFTISVASNDTDENPVTWNVIAVAEQAPVARPEIQVSRSGTDISDGSLDSVGPILAGNPQQLTYDIDNLGSDLLTLGVPQITATSNCAVAIIAAPAANVGAATGTTMLLSVTPTASGVGWSFTWSLATNDGGEDPTDITVVGTGLATPGPEIVVDRNGANIADAGADAVGATYTGLTTALTYTVTNAGDSDLVLNPAATLTSLVNCTATIVSPLPGTLPASDEGDLMINVQPTANGAWSFVVTIANNDADESPYNFTVSGTASAAPGEIAVFDASSTSLTDGATVSVNPTGATLTYTITNVGLDDLTLTLPVTLGAASNCAPVVTTAPAATIPAGDSTTLVITVNATAPTTTSWSFSLSIVNDDADENPFNLLVQGLVAPEITITRGATVITADTNTTVSLVPANDSAADTITTSGVGLASDLTYVVTNAGVSVLNIASATVISNTNCSASIVDGLPSTLAAAAADNLIVRVTPGATSATSGWWCLVQIVSNDADEATFNLTIASPAPGSMLPELVVRRGGVIADGATDSPSGGMAQTTSSLTYTLENIGLGSLSVDAVSVNSAANCTVSISGYPAATVAAGGSTGLTVSVTPTAAGTWSFGLQVDNNDSDEDPMDWVVAGTADAFAITPTTLGLSGGGGGCGAGGTGLIIAVFALFSLRLRRSTRR